MHSPDTLLGTAVKSCSSSADTQTKNSSSQWGCRSWTRTSDVVHLNREPKPAACFTCGVTSAAVNLNAQHECCLSAGPVRHVRRLKTLKLQKMCPRVSDWCIVNKQSDVLLFKQQQWSKNWFHSTFLETVNKGWMWPALHIVGWSSHFEALAVMFCLLLWF